MTLEPEVTEAGTSQEWDPGTTMLANQGTHHRGTVDAYKGYETLHFSKVFVIWALSCTSPPTPCVVALISARPEQTVINPSAQAEAS